MLLNYAQFFVLDQSDTEGFYGSDREVCSDVLHARREED
jgi:hypothetical protein